MAGLKRSARLCTIDENFTVAEAAWTDIVLCGERHGIPYVVREPSADGLGPGFQL